MSDFSLDDILNEIDSKKKNRTPSEDSGAKPSYPSITEELARVKGKKSSEYTLDDILGSRPSKKASAPPAEELKSDKKAETGGAAPNKEKKAKNKPAEMPVTGKADRKADKKADKKSEVKADKKDSVQEKKPSKPAEPPKPPMTAGADNADKTAVFDKIDVKKPTAAKTQELERRNTLELEKLRINADTADITKKPKDESVKKYEIKKKKDFVVNIKYEDDFPEYPEEIPQPLMPPEDTEKPAKKEKKPFSLFGKKKNAEQEDDDSSVQEELKQLEENLEKQAEAERLNAQREEEARKAEADKKAAEEKKLAEKQAAEEKKQAEKQAAEEAKKKAEEDKKAAEEAEKQRLADEQKAREEEEKAKQAAFEESERKMTSKSIVLSDVSMEFPWKIDETEEIEAPEPPKPTTEEIALEEERRRLKRKLEDEQRLQRDKALEHPDDFLDAINPYDLSSEVLTSEFETLPAESLAGDTISVAGNELKEMTSVPENAERIIDEDAPTIVLPDVKEKEDEDEFFKAAMDLFKDEVQNEPEEDDSEIKEYTPASKQKKKSPESEKYRRSDDALLESLNRKIEKKRESDIRAASTIAFTQPLPNVVTHGLNIDYNKKIIPATGTLPVENPVIEEAKARELAARKKHKIKDFVLEDIDDYDYDDYDDEDDEDEFDDFDSAGQIWSDLTETHKSLKTRFALLFILTVVLVAVTILGDMGVNLSFELFGNNIQFLEKRMDPTGFTFFNMIIGVLGVALCSSVIVNGIRKLFTMKGDCDSVCAVTAVFSIVSSILFLTDADLLIQSRAHMYISAAMVGLMFNTLGKLSMISRARRNFRYVSGDSHKYYAYVVENDSEASAFTKGVVSELPFLVTMRKTEYLTDFLRKSYSDDKADKISRILAPASVGLGLLLGLIAYFLPNGIAGMENSMHWAATVAIGTMSILSPFSIMFLVNYPLARASKALSANDSAVLGYAAVEDFCSTNAIMTDAALLFPSRSIECAKIKLCPQKNSVNNIAIDMAIILAASLAIESNSILSNLFYDMIGGKKEMLADIEGCVFEDDMGVMGWYGNKRLILGNREQMKHHGIKVPDMKSVAQYCVNNAEAVYLAVGGELTVIFFIRVNANAGVKAALRQMMKTDISLVVKTTDSLVSVNKLADVFDIDPEKVKVLPYSLHSTFGEYTKYTSRGSAAISCGGTFSSFAKAVVTAKKLMKEINITSSFLLAGVFLAVVLSVIFTLAVTSSMFSASTIIGYNFVWLIILLLVQSVRRY